jgi:glycosyltransferase involved in cell wall biosynthesis
MKVLFISSGNAGPDPISRRQGNSLRKIGIEVEFYDLVGKGFSGYLSNVPKLKRYIKSINPDLLHAHYSLSGFVTTLTFTNIPIVVSLMGSDVYASGQWMKGILKVFMPFWKSIIVKTEGMYTKLGKRSVNIIPNGVDFSLFFPMNSLEARERLGWNQQKRHILFTADPKRPEKNFALAERALTQLKSEIKDPELHYLVNISMDEMVYHYNAADLLLLTSFYEGSPNVIKEAMACNCPIVATEVGDIKDIIQFTDGCFLTTFEPDDVEEKIRLALSSNKRTNGREHIARLDAANIAQRIFDLYKKVLRIPSIDPV